MRLRVRGLDNEQGCNNGKKCFHRRMIQCARSELAIIPDYCMASMKLGWSFTLNAIHVVFNDIDFNGCFASHKPCDIATQYELVITVEIFFSKR